MATERQIGIALTSWVKANYPDVMFMHIANEGHHRKVVEGVLPGASDYLLAEAMSFYCGLFLEIKTERGKLSDKQKKFGERIMEKGYHWEVTYGFEQSMDAIKRYMSL